MTYNSCTSGDGDRFIIVEVALRDDGTITGLRVGSSPSERMAFNTVLELNATARLGTIKMFYQIEHQFGVDIDRAF